MQGGVVSEGKLFLFRIEMASLSRVMSDAEYEHFKNFTQVEPTLIQRLVAGAGVDT